MLKLETKKYGKIDVHLLYLNSFDIAEHINKLLPNEMLQLNEINHIQKKIEYVAIRTLRTIHFGDKEIFYSKIGAPYIEGNGFISISHANGVVGLAYCEDFKVGLDLELIREKVLRVKHKFLGTKEKIENDINSIETLIKIWSGKEALYKLAGRKKIIFAEQLFLTQKDDLQWNGEMRFPDCIKKVELLIDKKDNFVISINTGPVYEHNI